MKGCIKKYVPVETLTEALLRKDPVWEFCNDDEAGETCVRPVKKLPVTSGDCRLFGCEFQFRDGSRAFGFIGNLSLSAADKNRHFLTVSVFVGSEIYHLARYHDFDVAKRGPATLAKKFGKKEDDMFPIAYDLSDIAAGSEECIRGTILKEPMQRLTRGEIIQLALRR